MTNDPRVPPRTPPQRSSGTGSYIGNDVMDLTDPRCRDRSPGDRLAARILSGSERIALEGVTEAGAWRLALWAHWAAKEAAYKVGCKAVAAPGPFVPTALVCELDFVLPDAAGVTRIAGTVRSIGAAPPVTISGASDGSHLHVFGWSGPTSGPSGARLETGLLEMAGGSVDQLADLRDQFTASEWAGVRSRPSAVVRIVARERIRRILENRDPPGDGGGGPARIVTSRGDSVRIPPTIEVDGHPLPGWDLSLSHHGRYVAWALLVPE